MSSDLVFGAPDLATSQVDNPGVAAGDGSLVHPVGHQLTGRRPLPLRSEAGVASAGLRGAVGAIDTDAQRGQPAWWSCDASTGSFRLGARGVGRLRCFEARDQVVEL